MDRLRSFSDADSSDEEPGSRRNSGQSTASNPKKPAVDPRYLAYIKKNKLPDTFDSIAEARKAVELEEKSPKGKRTLAMKDAEEKLKNPNLSKEDRAKYEHLALTGTGGRRTRRRRQHKKKTMKKRKHSRRH